MAKEPSTVSYELYLLGKRGWELSGRFAENERYLALKSAKDAENGGGAAKIIREIYYPRRNENEEVVAYLSRHVKEVQASLGKASPRDGGYEAMMASIPKPGTDDDDDDDYAGETPEARARRKKSVATEVTMRAVLVGFTSLLLAGFATGLASMFVGQLSRSGVGVSSGSYSMTLFAVFIGVFMVAAVPLGLMFVAQHDGGQRPQRSWWSARKEDDEVMVWDRGDTPRPGSAPAKEDQDQKEATVTPLLQAVPEEPPNPAIALEPLPPLPEPEPAAAMSAVEEALDEPEPERPAETPAATEGMEKLRVRMMRFLSGAVTALKGTQVQLDHYNKFGLHLIVAGAADLIGERFSLPPQDRIKMTGDTLEVLGTKGALAKSFCDKLGEYYQTPRYLDMIKAGRAIMERMLASDPEPYATLPNVMKEWNAPTSATQSSSIIAVMFTDMVGSTNLTQTRGDDMAQVLVRTHNTIVRGALGQHGGREVKHTGDGIMASFTSTASAVEAAIEIQRAVSSQPRSMNLHLRIGLNAGEPIQEDNDLFGTTVQLAARICAQCQTDAILVSNVVKELCAGRPMRFVSRGLAELKGVTDPQHLFEVEWREGAAQSDPAPVAANPAATKPAAPAAAAKAGPTPSGTG